MASKFQSRLVGTIILVAIGVIVLPDVLDGQKLHYKEEFATIPIKPELSNEVESFEILEPVEDDIKLPDSPVVATVGQSASTSSETQQSQTNRNLLKSKSTRSQKRITTKIQHGSFS